jgi:quercetin dioxygenase-like cupin family protein
MRTRLTCLGLIGAIVAATAFYHPGSASTTTADGYKSTSLAVGRFGEIDVFTHFVSPSLTKDKRKSSIWLSRQMTKGLSDLYVQSNVWLPRGSTGWHSHAGHSLIIVTQGAVTDYEGDDPNCKPHVYTQGMGFVDPGGDHVHILRNEGNVEAMTIVVQLIPSDVARRIDAADPGNCPF